MQICKEALERNGYARPTNTLLIHCVGIGKTWLISLLSSRKIHLPRHPALRVLHDGKCAVFLLPSFPLTGFPSLLGGRVVALPGSRSLISSIARAPGRPAAPIPIHRIWNTGNPPTHPGEAERTGAVRPGQLGLLTF